MSSPLKGKIVKILTPVKVVINLGLKQGVKKDMRFIIYDEGDMIYDPDTNTPIEKLEIVKGEVTVTHVQELVSVAESFKIVEKVYNPNIRAIMSAFQPEVQETKEWAPLTVEKTEESSIILPIVKVGDLVREII